MEGSVLFKSNVALKKLVADVERRLCERTGFKGFYDVQREALLRVLEKLISEGRVRGVVQMPTGSGKTVLAAAVIAGVVTYYSELGYEGGIFSLFLTPRTVIRRQAYEAFIRAVLGVTRRAGVKEVESSADFCDALSMWSFSRYSTLVTVVTPQLLVRVFNYHKRCWELLREYVSVVIVDEAHTYYVGEKASQAVKDLVESDIPVVLGLTATPLRDTLGLIGNLIYHKHSRELMDGHVLAKELIIKVYSTRIEKLRLRHLPGEKESKKNEWELSWLYAIRERANEYAEVILEVLKDLKEKYLGNARYPKALVVAPNVNEANMIYEKLCEKLRTRVDQSPSRAGKRLVYIAHYEVSEAHEQVEAFKRASEGILVAVNMVDIGFDDPNLEVMFLARPVENPIAYAQLRGRVLRRPQLTGGGNDVNLKSVHGAFIVDLVGREDKRILEAKVPSVEEGHYGKEEYDFAIKELEGMKRVKEAEAKVSVEYKYEYRVSSRDFAHRELKERVEVHEGTDTKKLLLVKCLEDLLSKGICEITCPKTQRTQVPLTKIKFKVISRPTYFQGKPEERVVVEIANCERDEIKMRDLLKKDGTIDHRKLVTWIFKTLTALGLTDCLQFMLKQCVLPLEISSNS